MMPLTIDKQSGQSVSFAHALCSLLTGIFLFAVLVLPAHAHQMRLAYLQLDEVEVGSYRESDSQVEPESYNVLWKRVTGGEVSMRGLTLLLPQACSNLTEPFREMNADGLVERWRIQCPDGLAGGLIRIDGLAEISADALVRVQYANGASNVIRLNSTKPEFVIEAAPGVLQVAVSYLGLGIEHILLGLDHLLFVLALLLIVRCVGLLVATVTAFTVAHSITLGLATLGIVNVPIAPVEAIIALSIVFVASEIVRMRRGKTSLTATSPWLVAFVFGLLHGFGFASVLSEVGLPQIHIPLALLFFNLGVEAGQMLFIGVFLSSQSVIKHFHPSLPLWTPLAPPYVVGSVAMFWVIQRIAAF